MNSGEKLVGNSFFLFTDWFSLTVLSLLYWFVIGKTLPPENYGIIATSTNLILMISGLSLIGMQLTVPKLVSEYAQKKQYDKLKSLVSFSMKIVILIVSAISLSMILFSGFFTNLFNLPLDALIIVSVSLFVWSLWSLSTSILLGLQNMKYIFQTNLVGNILRILLAVAMISAGFAYVGPLAATLIGLFLIILLRWKFFSLYSPAKINKKQVIMKYAIPAFVAGIAVILFSNAPNIILNTIQGPAVTGLFAIAITVSSPLATIPSTFSSASFPIVSALSTERNPNKKQMRLINFATRYSFFMTIPAFTILIVFAEKILLMFSRVEYLPAVQLIPIIALSTIVWGVGQIFNSSIYAIRKPNVSRNIVVLSTITFFVMAFPLTYILSSFGTAVSYLASTLVFAILSYAYLRKSIKLKFDSMVFMKIISSSILFGAIIYSVKFFDNIIIKFLLLSLGIASYFGILLVMKYYSKDDARVFEIISMKSPVFKKQIMQISKFISDNS